MNNKASFSKRISFLNARMTSTLSVSLVLFILGIMVLMGFLANNLSRHVKENIGFSIVLNESAGDQQVHQLQRMLERADYVKAAQYISKEDALKEVMIELGENPEDVLTLVKGGVPIKKVNIGNMHMAEGKRQVATSVAVNDDDVACFRKLQELGVELEIKRVPDTPTESTDKLFK